MIRLKYLFFFLNRKADYYRYKSEITVGDEKKDASKGSADSYQKANEEAEELSVTHPIRLGLALNYSVFYYEIIQDSEKACTIAKKVNRNYLFCSGHLGNFINQEVSFFQGFILGTYRDHFSTAASFRSSLK